MTIALGILCTDGVVLGVDTQVSLDGEKLPGPKIQVFWESLPDYNLVSASSGNIDSIETARMEIQEELEQFRGKTPVVREIRRSIELALERVYARHINCLASRKERQEVDFELLIAVRVGRTARLFRTSRAQVVEQHHRWCIGSGKGFADYALNLYLGRLPTVELAAQVSAYVIGITKERVEGVGHATDVHVIQSDGRHWSLLHPDAQAVEKKFGEFFKTIQDLVACADSNTVTDEGIGWRMDLIGKSIADIRRCQRDRMEMAARRLSAIASGQLNPESPTADSRPPQPSPESRGGSGES